MSGGPKFYAYIVQKPDGSEVEVCKVKGITLNHSTRKLINYKWIRAYVSGEIESPLQVEYLGIRRTKFHDVVTRKEIKSCKPVYAKRWFESDMISYPFGYSETVQK